MTRATAHVDAPDLLAHVVLTAVAAAKVEAGADDEAYVVAHCFFGLAETQPHDSTTGTVPGTSVTAPGITNQLALSVTVRDAAGTFVTDWDQYLQSNEPKPRYELTLRRIEEF